MAGSTAGLAPEDVKDYFRSMSFASAPGAVTRSGTAWREVHLAAAAKGFSACGDFLIATTLVLTFQSAGFGGLAVAAVLLATAVPKVLLAPLAGRVADRVDSRRLLVAAGLGQAAIATVLSQTDHPVAIVAQVFLLSVGLAVSSPTISALIPAIAQREDLPRAGAISQTASTIGMMTGPALAGFLLGQFAPMVPLLLSAVSYLALVAGVRLELRVVLEVGRQGEHHLRAHVRDQLAPLKRMFTALRGLEEWGVRIIAGEVDLEALEALPANEAVARLSAIRGIGPWTAEIYLMFCVGHPDIFPVGDLALRKAVGL